MRRHLSFTAIALSGLFTLSACGEKVSTQCTSAPQSDWLNVNDFQAKLSNEGYTINQFKQTEGNCYEIYGFEPDGTKVEIYFNPVDASIVKLKAD